MPMKLYVDIGTIRIHECMSSCYNSLLKQRAKANEIFRCCAHTWQDHFDDVLEESWREAIVIEANGTGRFLNAKGWRSVEGKFFEKYHHLIIDARRKFWIQDSQNQFFSHIWNDKIIISFLMRCMLVKISKSDVSDFEWDTLCLQLLGLLLLELLGFFMIENPNGKENSSLERKVRGIVPPGLLRTLSPAARTAPIIGNDRRQNGGGVWHFVMRSINALSSLNNDLRLGNDGKKLGKALEMDGEDGKGSRKLSMKFLISSLMNALPGYSNLGGASLGSGDFMVSTRMIAVVGGVGLAVAFLISMDASNLSDDVEVYCAFEYDDPEYQLVKSSSEQNGKWFIGANW
ncbi:hypothetical protein IEQ34_011726 [Dendrobium chrysotoxum]|uniref:Uncharacterized protein n=1 Tax=Dendrobium chrysotoxum TaxID=161865 RepID=A0AAV7GTP7_DENCH|nr:hypothetical protein IEQ34_011726 [Dendrobium chrysotoxum]